LINALFEFLTAAAAAAAAEKQLTLYFSSRQFRRNIHQEIIH
jgi:hypothetical protein